MNFFRFKPATANTFSAARRLVTRIISLLALAALLTACSTVKLAYNQAPELAYWYLDRYLNFTEAQSLQLRKELARLQAWHRQTQLPAYVQTLEKLQLQLAGDVSAQDACAAYADLRVKLMALSHQAEPAMAALALTLQAGQLEQLERKFAEGDADYREDYLDGSPKAMQARRYKRAVGRAEMLYGALSEPQRALIRQSLAQSRFDPGLAYTERLRRQADALSSLRAITTQRLVGLDAPEKTRASMHALVARAFDSPSMPYRAYADLVTQDNCQGFADLHNSSTPAQRGKAIETLKGYQQLLQALAAQK